MCLLVAILGQALFWLVSCFSWLTSVQVVTGFRLSLISSFIQVNIINIGKYIPGKIWGLASRGVDLKQRGINSKETFLSSYIDQLLLLHAGIIVGVCSIAFSKSIILSIIVSVSSMLSVFLMPKCHCVLNKLMKRLNKNIDFKETEVIFSIKSYAKLFGIYVVVWVLAGLIFASIYFAFYGVRFNLLLLLIGANSIGIIIGFMAIFSPGGLGIREAASIGIMIESIPAEEAIFLALIYRLWTVCTDASGGVLALFSYFITREIPSSLPSKEIT
jgi:hypothetical protein